MRPEDTELAERPLAEVETIYAINYREIVAQLRKMADDIEAGKWGEAEDAAFVLQTDKGIEVFGWGKAVITSTIGLMQLGVVKMCRIWEEVEAEKKA